jgi:heme/copper-type cytochrome/quinol oxidase subunit 2
VIHHSVGLAIFWIAAASCTVAQILILASALKSAPPAGSSSTSVPAPRRSVEIAWTILPAIALCALLVATWASIHRPASPAPHEHHMAPVDPAAGP